MTNRHTDAYPCPSHDNLPPLPIIDWSLVGGVAPTPLDIYNGAKDPLPKADVVVITWTSAEWSALDHVFLHSTDFRYASSRDFEHAWHPYQYEAPASKFSPLWGLYRMVSIENAAGKKQKVLLFKASAHLAHPPWIKGLLAMMDHIIAEAKPRRIYSIGTAGGSTDEERLGDTAITNSGHIELRDSENAWISWNDTTVSCDTWYPSFSLVPDVETHLLYKLNSVVTKPLLEHLICNLHQQVPSSASFGYDDLVSDPIRPSNLGDPKGLDKKGVPLLTTDYYYIADGSSAAQYCVLEMDDTVIGYAAGKKGVDYAFVRNVSDPLVPAATASGGAIPAEVREGWSSLSYEKFGLYTSMNGALLTWATIAGDPGSGGSARSTAKSKAAPARRSSRSSRSDDLTTIEGIGPKSAAQLRAGGFGSFAKVAAATAEQLRRALEAGGSRFNRLVPSTWPEQAKLAAAGSWDELAALQRRLKGGR